MTVLQAYSFTEYNTSLTWQKCPLKFQCEESYHNPTKLIIYFIFFYQTLPINHHYIQINETYIMQYIIIYKFNFKKCSCYICISVIFSNTFKATVNK